MVKNNTMDSRSIAFSLRQGLWANGACGAIVFCFKYRTDWLREASQGEKRLKIKSPRDWAKVVVNVKQAGA